MIIILSIPAGLLCLLLATLCLRVNRKKHALTLSLLGLSFLGLAAAMIYWSNLLIEQIPAGSLG
ncbi:hypothetical protein DESUT3_30890 [Desulfuromonas versatilis]|uniref:Uncharacterized protein n=1 Tax=Desulfuromonas versatilis TaxID=2802975 RepID=A0ABN6E0Y2_9BACT|nr:hypothetical protein [Desulfuromonas versatilis]BCR06020.1 hypothetical protein DESUT3_30890 [Desulfuromonas versatilis]